MMIEKKCNFARLIINLFEAEYVYHKYLKMKTLVITFFAIFLFLPTLIFGQSLFDRGNQAYKTENYQQAIDLYEEVITSGEHSAELYYNLANAYYKLNKIAPSIYNYEKALLLNPNNYEVKNNLKFVQNRMVDPIKEVSKTGFNQWLHGFTGVFYYDTWSKIAIVFSFLVLFSFIGYYFAWRIGFKRVFFGLMILFLVNLILSILISSFEKKMTENNTQAIVFSESIAVKSEPNQNSVNVALLHEGTKVEVLEELDDYYKVVLPDQNVGWLVKKSVKLLNL